MKRLLTVHEAAEYLGVSVQTLYQWTSQRRIPYFKQGNMIRFDIKELDKFIKERTIIPNKVWNNKQGL